MSMTKQANNLLSLRNQRLRSDRRHFRLFFAVTFMVFLVVFTFASLMPGNWTSRARAGKHRKGIVERARAEANVLASFGLMR